MEKVLISRHINVNNGLEVVSIVFCENGKFNFMRSETTSMRFAEAVKFYEQRGYQVEQRDRSKDKIKLSNGLSNYSQAMDKKF